MGESYVEEPLIIEAFPDKGEAGKIHIYGANPGKPSPFLLAIHGGGWTQGNQSSFAWLWPRIRGLGISLVLPSYRLAPQFAFPVAYDDLVDVCKWLGHHGTAHGLDATRGVLFGSSAGGHLAMLLATRGMKEVPLIPRFRGVAAYCGPVDLFAQNKSNTAMTKGFLAATPEQSPERYRDASPIFHIHRDMPPVWLAHGSADQLVSVSHSREMVAALQQGGHKPVYLEARNLGHTMCETEAEGASRQPLELLFEPDLLRFIQHVAAQHSVDSAKA